MSNENKTDPSVPFWLTIFRCLFGLFIIAFAIYGWKELHFEGFFMTILAISGFIVIAKSLSMQDWFFD